MPYAPEGATGIIKKDTRCLVLSLYVFYFVCFFVRAYFIIGLWADEDARK
jgi:hypothetical protein